MSLYRMYSMEPTTRRGREMARRIPVDELVVRATRRIKFIENKLRMDTWRLEEAKVRLAEALEEAEKAKRAGGREY